MKKRNRYLELEPGDLLHARKLAARIVASAKKEFGAERVALYLLNPNYGDLEMEASLGVAATVRQKRLVPGQGLAGWVASRGISARADLQKSNWGLGAGGSEMAAPISEGENLMGVLVVGTRRKNFFSEGQESQLQEMALEAARWLGLAWKVAGTSEESRRSAALAEVGAAIGAEETPEAILNRVARESARLSGAKLASIFLLDPKKKELFLEVCLGGSSAYRKQPPLEISDTALGYVVRRGRPISVRDVGSSPQDPHSDRIQKEGLVSVLAVPLVEKKEGIGVLCVATAETRRFPDAEIRLLEGLAGLAAAALGRSRLSGRLDRTEGELRNRERLSSLGMLAAEVAHEVRNPLAVIRMLWHTALRGLQPSEAQAKDLNLIEAKLAQMNGILDRVLNLARSADPEIGAVDGTDLMEEVFLLTRTKLSAARIQVTKKVPPRGKAMIRGDRPQLEQAVLNLVLNAVEAMPKGGELKLGVQPREQNVFLTVQDSGRGMPKEITERLYEPFLSRRPGGTGLGMALVRRTVEAHGGALRVDSQTERGTRVEIRLPSWPSHRG
ncbi:MAG: GAF domain-containing protein [Verrucomicrobia bacterium]|nr:GAF domain-containing protein [Verrucomicrobiota bacterium]